MNIFNLAVYLSFTVNENFFKILTYRKLFNDTTINFIKLAFLFIEKLTYQLKGQEQTNNYIFFDYYLFL